MKIHNQIKKLLEDKRDESSVKLEIEVMYTEESDAPVYIVALNGWIDPCGRNRRFYNVRESDSDFMTSQRKLLLAAVRSNLTGEEVSV